MKRWIMYTAEVLLHDLPGEVTLVGSALSGADWGKRPKVSTAEVIYSDRSGPYCFIQSWAPAKIVPVGVLAEAETDEILDWVNEHRNTTSWYALEKVSVPMAGVPEEGLFHLTDGSPVLEILRIAYDIHHRPILTQLEKHRSDATLDYNRSLSWEKVHATPQIQRAWSSR